MPEISNTEYIINRIFDNLNELAEAIKSIEINNSNTTNLLKKTLQESKNKLLELISICISQCITKDIDVLTKSLNSLNTKISSFRKHLEKLDLTVDVIKFEVAGLAQLLAASREELLFISENKAKLRKTSINQSLSDVTMQHLLKEITGNVNPKLKEIEERQLTKEVAFDKKIIEFNGAVDSLEGKVMERINAVDELYKNTKTELDVLMNGIKSQIGTITASTMAKDYAVFSTMEKNSADEYRKYSLYVMFLIAGIVAATLWESSKGDLTITQSLIRLTLILLISAPAIYLSKESAKHREQEKEHRQTHLDLMAITPYIASLSPTEQSQLKTQIAMRLFGARNTASNQNHCIPINVNDLLLKLLDKVELSTKADSEKKDA